MTQPAAETDLIAYTVQFCRALRDRGLAVTPAEAIDAVRTLHVIDFADRLETFLSLRTVLASRIEDFPIFEELFESYWGGRAQSRALRRSLEQEPSSRVTQQVSRSAPDKRGIALLLENWGAAQSRDLGSTKLPGASDIESTAAKDFSVLRSDEVEEISRLARRIVKRLARRPSRRWKPVRRGPRVNLRRSFRRSLRTGGELVELSFKRRKQRKTRLVVICDVSGSMDVYSRLLLRFVYGLQNSFARVETFAFSTSLQRITRQLKERTYDMALNRLSRDARGWSGGTLIGRSIAAFNSGWPTLVDKRSIAIILSDGWDTGEPQELGDSLARLKRRTGRLIWLNPLLGSPAYRPLARGMQAALPHVDVFAPLHNLATLKALERHLVL